MKFSVLVSVGLVGVASAYVKTLTEYTKDIPQCAVDAMKIGMKNQGCDMTNVNAKDFDCICDHYLKIDGRVYAEVAASCAADYAAAAGKLCGAWAVESTSATDLPQATQALANILGAGAAKAQPTGDSNATVPAEKIKQAAPVKNNGPVPTGRIARSFGGAAVAAAAMHL